MAAFLFGRRHGKSRRTSAGFPIGQRWRGAALGISIIPPYQTYITYDVYITPGLLAMIQLFQGMQSSLSMVYDREMGSMRVLLTTPLPRWFLLVARLFGGVIVSLFQVYTFLLVAYFCGVDLPPGAI